MYVINNVTFKIHLAIIILVNETENKLATMVCEYAKLANGRNDIWGLQGNQHNKPQGESSPV